MANYALWGIGQHLLPRADRLCGYRSAGRYGGDGTD